MPNTDISEKKTSKKTKAKKNVTTKSSKVSPAFDNMQSGGKVAQQKHQEQETLAKKEVLTAPVTLKKDAHKLAQPMVDKPVASSNVQPVRRSENLSSAVLETRYQTLRRNPLGKVHADVLERRLAGN